MSIDGHRNKLAAVARGAAELHMNPEISHIAEIGMEHPEKLMLFQVRMLCAEVDRHICRIRAKR